MNAANKAALKATLAAQQAQQQADRESIHHANVETPEQSVEDQRVSLIEMMGGSWKKFAAKFSIGLGYAYLIGLAVDIIGGTVLTMSGSLILAWVCWIVAFATAAYILLTTTLTVVNFLVDDAPARISGFFTSAKAKYAKYAADREYAAYKAKADLAAHYATICEAVAEAEAVAA